ncbi:outer membrane beta-barrel protein [Lewinella sp. W8]|uniref:outer membrane beta-barrel protein n=1 Tax=Lewinella sp. W8 TaxID=2528208 RepID=UPI0010672D8D|nr:outer membrane beta-barrel protein [Lewinella sp. W8]MTB49632.1 outer membrane beta-barrel protein [Lewinella sp. W8]
MQKALLFLLAILPALLIAQERRGQWLINTNTGFTTNQGAPGIRDLLGSNAEAGYFLSDRLLLGASLQFGEVDGGDWEFNDNYVNPYLRYYLPGSSDGRLRYFAEIGGLLRFNSGSALSIRPGLGLEYEIARGIVLNAGLRYTAAENEFPRALSLQLNTLVLLGREGDPEQKDGENYRKARGTTMLNLGFGNATWGSLGSFDYKDVNLTFEASTFLTDNFLLEARLGAYYSDLGRESPSYVGDYLNLSASLGGRYLFRSGKRLQPYLAAGITYEYLEQRVDIELGNVPQEFSLDLQVNQVSYYGKAGVLYHLNDRLALDVNVGYDGVTKRINGGAGIRAFFGGN